MNLTVTEQASPTGYRLVMENESFACALGRAGIRTDKNEGDGATPVGRWVLRQVFYRPDKLAAPETGLAVSALAPNDGWCDDADDPAYNRFVHLPYAASHETLWRDDGLYDLIVPLGYNDEPPVPGKGSAIFLHCAHPEFESTEGCIAVPRDDLLKILRRARKGDTLEVPAHLAPMP